MKIVAVPLAGGKFSPHFGGAEEFAFVTVGEGGGEPPSVEVVPAPPHVRGAFPAWLRQRGVQAVIAGGMGERACSMLAQFGIDVVLGVGGGDPVTLASAYVAGTLVSGDSLCEGGGFHDCGREHGTP